MAAVISDPLVRVLISKGVLNELKDAQSARAEASEQRDRLALCCAIKGLLSAENTRPCECRPNGRQDGNPDLVGNAGHSTAEIRTSKTQTPAPMPTVIAAVASVRFGVLVAKREDDS